MAIEAVAGYGAEAEIGLEGEAEFVDGEAGAPVVRCLVLELDLRVVHK